MTDPTKPTRLSHGHPGLLAALVLLSAPCIPLHADDEPQSTHRAVSPENWTYAAMRSFLGEVAVSGLSPVHFLGDYTFNAREMAGMVWECYDAAGGKEEQLNDQARRWLTALLREFRWELASIGEPVDEALSHLEAEWQEGLQFYGDVSASLVGSNTGSPLAATASFGIAAFPSSPTNWAIVEGGYRPSDIRQDQLGRPPLMRASMYWRPDDFRAMIGRDLLRTSPGIRGGYTYSGTADPFEFARYRDRFQLFGSRFAVDFTLGMQTHVGQQTFLLSRRLEKRISPEIEIAFTESVKTKAFPTPLYYPLLFEWVQGVQEDWLGIPGSQENDNVMMHGEVYWRASPYVELYAEGALDEFDWSSFLDSIGVKDFLAGIPVFKSLGLFQGTVGANNNHGGYLLGAYLPDVLGNGRLRLRTEYAYSSRLMGIAHRSEALDYFYGGRPLQHRIGPDAQGVYVEADYLSGSDWAFKGYAEHVQRGISRPSPERETVIGTRWTHELGRDTALHLGLNYRRADNYKHVAGRQAGSFAATIGAHWWF